MARPLRIQYPDAVYHVTARGNERKAIVQDDEDRQRFIQTVADMVEQYQILCHAWVLMDNHYHLLIETPQANLSRAIRHLNGVYTQAYNRRHHRVGHLFQGRFTSILIEKETYLLELCRYVVLNPVRAGMVQHPKAWAWSSYRATAGEQTAPEWLTVDWLLGQLGKRRSRAQSSYRQFVSEGIKRQERPWSDRSGQVYLGSEAFLKSIQNHLTEKEDTEIPRIQKQPARPDIEVLLRQVAKGYGKSVEEVAQPTRRPSEARQVAIYCARRVAGLELRAIAKLFGMGYTAVSRRVREVAKRIENDQQFRKKIHAILSRDQKLSVHLVQPEILG